MNGVMMGTSESPLLRELLSPLQRLRYKITPRRLYAFLRARRDLRKYETELRLLPVLVDPNRNSIDVGANRGTYTFFLARLSKQVFAYEPNPAMHQYLLGAVADNVSVSNAAISDRTGTATFHVPRRHVGCHNTRGSLEAAVCSGPVCEFPV